VGGTVRLTSWVRFPTIVTLETGDMPQKRAFWTHSRQVAKAPYKKKYIEILIFTPAMGSCIKVVKQKKLVSY
jgi:hypothetical protein